MLFRRKSSYSDHLDYLLASIVYLGTSELAFRTPTALAGELALDVGKLKVTFAAFPGIFRKSKSVNQINENPYSLQARYARRVGEGDAATYPALPRDTLRLLYDFVQRAADEERTGWRTSLSLFASGVATVVTAGVAIYVATAKPEAPPARVCVVEQSSLICTAAGQR
jgi:hypothetical protein